jgi:hypothetical protein
MPPEPAPPPAETPITSPPSPQAASSDAAPVEVRSPETQDSKGPDIWERIFGKRPPKVAPPTDAPQPLTEQELDRRVQAETDRREAKRKRDQAEQERKDREAQIERKLDPRSPDFDPYGGAEDRDKLKQQEQADQSFSGFLQSVSKEHDSATLDPVMAALPETERQRILWLEGAGVGLEGRKLIMAEGLKALEKHWKAQGRREAEESLDQNPSLRKRLFHEFRGEVEEPELVPGNGAATGDKFMDMLQADYRHLKRGRR